LSFNPPFLFIMTQRPFSTTR